MNQQARGDPLAGPGRPTWGVIIKDGNLTAGAIELEEDAGFTFLEGAGRARRAAADRVLRADDDLDMHGMHDPHGSCELVSRSSLDSIQQ